MDLIKVGTPGNLDLHYPASGHDSFIAYVVRTMKHVYDVEFVTLRPCEDDFRVDLILLPTLANFYYSDGRNYSMPDLMSYIRDISTVQWYACWYASPVGGIPTSITEGMPLDYDFEPIKARRAICSFSPVCKEMEQLGLAEEVTAWTPPIKPIIVEKEPYIINSAFETTHELNLALLTLVPDLWEIGIELHVYKFDWYIDGDYRFKEAINIVDSRLHEGLKIWRGYVQFNEFQERLAKARILCSLRAGFELQTLEAWAHGTPVITRDTQGFLAPDYGIMTRCEEKSDITAIFQIIQGILAGDYADQIDRTVAHIRAITNVERQVEIIKSCLEKDLR